MLNQSKMSRMAIAAGVISLINVYFCQAMETSSQAHRDLVGKVKKLAGYDDIYVGAGYSDAGEPIFFAMERLDADRKARWREYANVINSSVRPALKDLINDCQGKELRDYLRKFPRFNSLVELMDLICADKVNSSKKIENIGGGLVGFDDITNESLLDGIYVAYASTQPITGPFKPQIITDKLMHAMEVQSFDITYPNIIMSIGVNMKQKNAYPITEHRGIFKNPLFDIRGKYKNISMKLHGWAGMVEKDIFGKKYLTIYPLSFAGKLLTRMVNSGDMYIGVDSDLGLYFQKKLSDYELSKVGKKFPPIEQKFIGIEKSVRGGELLHVFDLNILSKYYAEQSKK